MECFRNYTPDDIVLILPNDEQITFPSLGVAYITGKNIIIDRINGVEIRKKCYNEINGLPSDDTQGIIYIVTRPVSQENSRRENRRIDLVYPDTDHHDCLHDKNSIRTITGFVFQ